MDDSHGDTQVKEDVEYFVESNQDPDYLAQYGDAEEAFEDIYGGLAIDEAPIQITDLLNQVGVRGRREKAGGCVLCCVLGGCCCSCCCCELMGGWACVHQHQQQTHTGPAEEEPAGGRGGRRGGGRRRRELGCGLLRCM